MEISHPSNIFLIIDFSTILAVQLFRIAYADSIITHCIKCEIMLHTDKSKKWSPLLFKLARSELLRYSIHENAIISGTLGRGKRRIMIQQEKKHTRGMCFPGCCFEQHWFSVEAMSVLPCWETALITKTWNQTFSHTSKTAAVISPRENGCVQMRKEGSWQMHLTSNS